MVNHFVASALC